MGDRFSLEFVRRDRLRFADVLRVYIIGWAMTALALAPGIALLLYCSKNVPRGNWPWWLIVWLAPFLEAGQKEGETS